MAIWPFGRKGKRPRSQMKAADAAEKAISSQGPELSPVPEHGFAARKPSRKRSKRDKSHRRSPPPPGKFSPPHAAATDPLPPSRSRADRPASFNYNFENHTSLSSIGQENFTATRSTPVPMLQKRTSGGTLKKRLSKRSARELAREQEIRAMSSSPPSGHPRSVLSARDHHTWDIHRGPSAQSHRHASDHSLPMHDSARSSLSEGSDSYMFKVSAFAVFTPRPMIRCAETPKYNVPRSQNPSANSMRKDKKMLIDDENMRSTKRIAELADDMDAPALRELLERDRRRKKKKRLEEQERLQRRLQRRAERERRQDEERQTSVRDLIESITADDLRGRDRNSSPTTSTSNQHQPEQIHDEPQPTDKGQTGSWLRGPSRDSDARSHRLSDMSAHVIGNIDDRSIRRSKTDRHGVVVSQGTLSPSQSPVWEGRNACHLPAVPQGSVSDISRTAESEKRLSDNSGRRMASWTSFFRRGSPRKRNSWERGQGPPSEFSNTSRESFSKVQSPATGAPSAIRERSFLRTGTVNRTQSKFVEHLGDHPISPPDSRIQSPIPSGLEPVRDMSPDLDETSVPFDHEPGTAVSHPSVVDMEADEGPSRPLSWEASSRGTGPDSAFLSQSLASVDSEGSWMSGKYLRHISQNTANPVRGSGSPSKKLGDYEAAKDGEDVMGDEYFSHLADESPEQRNSVAGLCRASSTAMGVEGEDSEHSLTLESVEKEPEETWHSGLARRPTLVRPQVRPKSKEGLLNDVQMMDSPMEGEIGNVSPISPISPISPVSPLEEELEPVEIKRATSVDLGRHGQRHGRQISAGSARLLDIAPRGSFDSRRSERQTSSERT